MAQMLRDEDSTDRHLDVTRRHARRSRKTRNAGVFADRIAPVRSALEEAQGTTKRAGEDLEAAQDDVELAGVDIADLVRTAASRTKDYDRANPGAGTFLRVIPSGRLSDYVRSDGTVSVADADATVTRINGLAADHPARELAAQLTAAAAAATAAAAAEVAALRAFRAAEVAEEIAQAALRRQYEDNYLDARKQLREAAERLFPKIRRSRRRTEPADEETTPTDEPT